MKIYLAARYGRREELQQYRKDIEQLGFECTSRWLTGAHDGLSENDKRPTLEEQRKWATDDADDIMEANMLICFTEKEGTPFSRGGRHVEAGIAIGLALPVICVGPCENIFFALPEVQIVGNWLDAIKILVAKKKLDAIPA